MPYLKKLTVALGLMLAPVFGQVALAATGTPNEQKVTATDGARDIVQEIMNVVGLKLRFELRPAEIDNAVAVIYNGKRYILYNERFLASINSAVHTDWGGVSILAHEIGHHLNGHTLSRSGSNPADELEADEFSGFVLRKMGASMADAQAAIDLLSDDETSRTHPGRSYRLAAISKGWHSADDQLSAIAKAPQPDDKAIVSRPSQRSKANVAKQTAAVSNRHVLTRVNFSKLPEEQFFVTNNLNLVHVTSNGYKVIGKLARTHDPDFPFYFKSEYLRTVYVSEKGVLVNEKGQQVGHLST